MSSARISAAVLALAFAGVAGQPAYAQGPRLGTIEFPTSGAPAAQPAFVEGVLFLHSFEYASAARAFRRAQELDPAFALAYWGEAMTYTHPVWNEQDVAAAHAVLGRLGATPQARRGKAPTEREKLYLDAVEILYSEGSKPARDTAYAQAMARLSEAYPDDLEARAFHALAILGLNQGVRSIPDYMRAAAIVEEVFDANPKHPGAVHYLIHSYDDPIHAPLGLRAARAYSGIAPDAGHAQHMTTHIFVALGMWDDVVSQNVIASGLSNWLSGHYTMWLEYGYLQQGRHAQALKHLEEMRERLSAGAMAENLDTATRNRLAAVARMRADYIINTERWDSPLLDWPVEPPATFHELLLTDLFTRGVAAAMRGDRATAGRLLEQIAARNGGAGQASSAPALPAILEKQMRAALAATDGLHDEALALARAAAAIEDAMPFEFGPPAAVKPAHELLGDLLLRMDRPAEAQREYARALELTPRRAITLLGLARAASAAGDRATASQAYGTLREIWHGADADLPWLAEARRYAARRP
ncbi:MAG: hypothetical protein L0271_13365 [Gemmatimonadetes bacterium]|nr:hypothetical protein [Gemmatimonadota bacterium]